VISWTTMIQAYASSGMDDESLELFRLLDQAGLRPNTITYLGVLTACSHAGLVDDGHYYFVSMSRDQEIVPSVEHFHCMVDILARSGRVRDAVELVESMPFVPDSMALTTLLNSCRADGDVGRGASVAESLLRSHPENTSGYSLLAGIFA
ncbi:hypothetical protein SELMODRAFT_72055, partial [Selaginella moellendorffii]